MLGFLAWVLISSLVGVAAKQRNRSGFIWFFISVIVSPLLAAIALILVGEGVDVEVEKKQRTIDSEKYELVKSVFIQKYTESEERYASNPKLKEIYDALQSGKTVNLLVMETATSLMG